MDATIAPADLPSSVSSLLPMFPRTYVARYDYEPPQTPAAVEQLPLRVGDTVQVLAPRHGDGLVPVELYGARGLAPFAYLEPLATAAPRTRLLSQLGGKSSSSQVEPLDSEPVAGDHAGATIYRLARLV